MTRPTLRLARAALPWLTVAALGALAGAGLSRSPVRPTPGPPTREAAAADDPLALEAREPGRGRLAQSPFQISRRGWLDVLWRVLVQFLIRQTGFIAGGVTFFVILSLFPMLATFVTLYGLFSDPTQAWTHLALFAEALPPSVAGFVGPEMMRLATEARTALSLTLVGTLILSLWFASAAVRMLFHGLNLAYGETEKRNPVRYGLLGLAFTLGGLVFVLATTALVVALPAVLDALNLRQIADLGPLRWPVLYAVFSIGLALAYRFGPCRARARWIWVLPGALVAALVALIVSALFSWYLATFVRMDSYGPLGAVMGFLLWSWITIQVVLAGALLNAEAERQTVMDSTTGPAQPLGQRGAMVADTLGARRRPLRGVTSALKRLAAIAKAAQRRGL